MKKVKATKMEDFPSVKKVVLRLKDDGSGGTSKTYQGVEIIKLDQSLTFFASTKLTSIVCWLACMNDSRIALLMLPYLKILATHGWQKTDDVSFGLDAVQAFGRKV